MKTVLVRLLNAALLLGTWIAAFLALHWLALAALETQPILPGQVPYNFEVVVETRVDGAAPSYAARRFQAQSELRLEPGESLHLGTRAYDQTEHEITDSCCIAFRVLEDGPDGQLVELDDDDMTYVRSRYRVRDGQVEPLSHRAHFTLYYLAYLLLGWVIAWLATRPLRRRALAWARAGDAAKLPAPVA
jgi:hypothetical protein